MDVCESTLPVDFNAKTLTQIKQKAILHFHLLTCLLLKIVEIAFMSLVNKNDIFLRDSFESVLDIVCKEKLPIVGCNNHFKTFMVDVIYEYLLLRCRCIAQKKMMKEVDKEKTRLHAKRKVNKILKQSRNKRQ